MVGIIKGIGVIVMGVLLAACGNDNPPPQSKAAVETTTAKAEPKANNPLAKEQQLIEQAKGIQSMLDKDTEEKKKAMDELN